MADDDLEQELLQVTARNRAGGSAKRGRGKAAASDSEENLFSGSDDSEEDYEPRERARATRQPPRKKGRASARQEEEEEEEDAEEDGGYGSDLYIDEEDRQKLSAMNELQREMILAERAEERDKQRQRKALLKKAKDEKSRAATTGRLSSRQRKALADKDSAIRQIQAARKRQSRKQKAEGRKGGKGSGTRDWSESDDESGDEDEDLLASDEESEQADDRPASAQPAGDDDGLAAAARRDNDDDDVADREEEDEHGPVGGRAARRYSDDDDDEEDVAKEDASHDDLRSVQVKRSQLEAWHDQPFFNGDGMAGIVVRMAYGAASAGQAYMLMVVHDVKEDGKPYAFGARQAPCSKYLVLHDAFGNAHTMAMQNVSNQPFEDLELERYHRHCKRVNRKALTHGDVEDAKRKIQAAAEYRWDAGKVREVLERKRAAGQLPVNIAAEKSRLRRLLEAAKANGQEQDVERIEQQLRDVEGHAKAKDEKPGNTRNSGMTNINERNKKMNFNIAYKNVSNKPAGASERKGGADPFSRRQTRPKVYWNTKSDEAKAAAATADKEAAASREASKKSQEAAKLSSQQMKLDPAELIRQLDITIDLGLLEQPSAPLLTKRLLGRRWQECLSHSEPELVSNRILMSIDDWKQRAG